jgi:hypothetical protein
MMATTIAVVAQAPDTRDALVRMIPGDAYQVTAYPPGDVPDPLPDLFVIGLPALESPEEQMIEQLRSDDATAPVPIVIASHLSMAELHSVPYASDWTIAIVEYPVDPQVLTDTMTFLLNPGTT